MQTHLKKRIDLIIEMPLLRRVTERFDQAGVSGYSVLHCRPRPVRRMVGQRAGE